MDNAALIALISTLLVSIVANIAAWWQIAAQSKKDKRQADIDDKRVEIEESKAENEKEAGDRAAMLAVTESLRLEVERLQKKSIDLEDAIIKKTTEIGELKLAAIDKEAELRTMRYTMQMMQMKLDGVSKEQPEKRLLNLVDNEMEWDTDVLSMKLEAEEDQKKKDMISKDIDMEIEEVMSDSVRDIAEEQ